MMIELPMKTYSTGKQVVNWAMVSGSYNFGESIVEVITNKMVEKIAKVSGNKRKERRLEVRLNGFEDVYECGTESFKKGSFLKNLIKKSIHKIIETMVKPTNYLPMIYNPIRKNFIGETDDESIDYICKSFVGCESIREIRNVYKRFAKMYHPDSLGRELFPHELLVHEHILKVMKDGAINQFRAYDKVMAEWEDDEELPVEDLMKMWDITEEDLMED